jgi:hypothetical protein
MQKKTALICVGLLCATRLAVGAGTSHLDRTAVSDAVVRYLAQRGDLCLGKFDWPVDVSALDFEAKTRDALQMPVLEKLGLVVSIDGSTTYKSGDKEEVVPVKRYLLTDNGRKFYLPRDTTSRGPGAAMVTHHADFCAGHLYLKDIVRWETPIDSAGETQTTVTYTYKFKPAPWALDPAARKVFPMVDRIIKGQGTLRLEQRFRVSGSTLTPIDSVE